MPMGLPWSKLHCVKLFACMPENSNQASSLAILLVALLEKEQLLKHFSILVTMLKSRWRKRDWNDFQQTRFVGSSEKESKR